MKMITTLVLSLFFKQVSSIHIDLTPSFFVEAATAEINITCFQDSSLVHVKKILLMEISKNGETPIVNFQPPNHLNYGYSERNHFEAKVLINDSNVAESYLSLKIKYPTKEDAGAYTCVMSYLDEAGLLKQDRDKAGLVQHSGDSGIEIMVSLRKSVKNLLERVKAVEITNQLLLAESKNQSQLLQDLQARVNLAVAFSAAVNQDKMIRTGETILFPDVLLNEGQGYNEKSGIFTAPVAGLYAFHLVLEIGSGGAAGEVWLKVAEKNAVKMYTQDRDFGDQGSVSVVSRLHKGDTAKVVVRVAVGGNPHIFGERNCVFSGILIRS